jgi:hypothetical protein
MEMSSRDWTQQYEALKRKIQHQRISGVSFTPDDIRLLHKQMSILEAQLKTMSGNALEYELVASEIARRETLLANVKALIGNLYVSGGQNSGAGSLSGKQTSPYTSNPVQSQAQRQADMMKLQDDMLNEIGTGVGRLHGKALIIGEEAKAHVRLLDDLDSNVEIASAALQAEAKHAAEIKEKGKVCYMYICIAVECAVLLLLIILAVQ